jgi:hypothetical protein
VLRAIIALTVATIFFISGCSSNFTKQRKRSSQYSQKDKGKIERRITQNKRYKNKIQKKNYKKRRKKIKTIKKKYNKKESITKV